MAYPACWPTPGGRAFREAGIRGKVGIILNRDPPASALGVLTAIKASPGHSPTCFLTEFSGPCGLGRIPRELIDLLREHGQLPETREGDGELLKEGKVDLLGINYYQPRRVKAKGHSPNPYAPFMPEWFFDPYEMPGRKMNPYRGWEIYEKGIYDILINLKENYGNIESYVSENGMGD